MTATLPEGLLAWALEQLGEAEVPAAAAAVAGDASNRRYFRLRLAERSVVLVHAPPATEKNHAFVEMADLLASAGVHVPEVLAADFGRGFLLLEDLGDDLLLPLLTSQTANGYYHQAAEILLQLAAVRPGDAVLPVYDAAVLGEELGRFPEWFVAALLRYRMGAADLALWESFAARLVQNALEQPQVLVHRDFHSRNLMLQPDGGLAVIDFQDALLGPVTYDPVSLLRDCYIRWPAAQVRGWALAHRDALVGRELLAPTPDEVFLRWFDLTGLQRHIKVLGNFARLSVRDGRHGYLGDLPMVITYVLEVLDANAAAEPLCRDFAHWLRDALLPAARERDWGAAL
ncbi:MAG: phosphotransferase [Halioglobus sp.]|nr:phosphotransferase [Halioglobus sp.]